MEYAAMVLQTPASNRPFFYRAGSSDEGVIRQIFTNGDYALNRLRRFPDLLRYVERRRADGRRPLILDAGANIGASSVYFSVGFPDSVVVSVEPDRENFQLLARNSEGLAIEPMLAAVSSRVGQTRVVDAGEGFWGYRTGPVADGAPEGDAVQCRRINDIYAACEPRCFPFIAKIDIEGGEGELFLGNTEWVARTPVLIIELHDWMLPGQRTSASFLRCIAGLDRDFVYFGENVFSVANDLDAI